MTERVLGEKGSKRRKRFLLLPVLATALLALFWIAGAQGVHLVPDSSLQLDKDATSYAIPGPPTTLGPPPADDWDLICKAHSSLAVPPVPVTCSFRSTYTVPSGTTTATQSTFAVDVAGATTFDTGGSKDDLDINNWRQSPGSSPPKDELTDGFAALYQVGPPAESRLYFGADRFANNGSAQIGFWFFQNSITLSGNAFTGTHVAPGKGANGEWCSDGDPNTPPEPDPVCVRDADDTPGDLLILSDFTQGGAISTIRIFEWVGTGGTATANGTLEQVAAGIDCTGAVHPPDLCGEVNGPEGAASDGIPSPWPYTPKFGTNGTFPFGSLYEGGVDLTAFGFGSVCFASFLVETRSAPSVDATLKDFVLGAFAPCTANIVTTPSSTEVAPGEQVRDSATITGSGPSAPAPKGTVTFFLCAKDVEPCATDGTQVGLPVDLSTNTTNPVTVNSDFVNTATAQLAPGRYCFAAVWTNDPVYDDDSDRTTGECFTVRTIPTAISTAQFVYPNDTATVSTGTGTLPLTGSVLFKAYIGTAGPPAVSALDNCNANTSTGLLFSESQAVDGGLASETVSTTNATHKLPPTTTVYWRVLYTSGSTTYEDRQSVCLENTNVTFNDDSSGGTKP